jgi:putative peptide zinc metalloprotease protein
MAGFPSGSLVQVRPFTHHRDGDTVNIGVVEQGIFLEIPAEGLDILNWLADGRTVGETADLYERKHGETADIEDFLAALSDEGFLQPAGTAETTADPTVTPTAGRSACPGSRPTWRAGWSDGRCCSGARSSWPPASGSPSTTPV